jgi:hypothetical protein
MDTIYTLATINKADPVVGCIEDYVKYSPEISQIVTRATAGTTIDVVSREGIPSAVFRLANQPISASSSTFKRTTHQLVYLDSPIVIDDMVYKGDDQTAGDLLMLATQGAIQAVYATAGNQFYYGQQYDGSNGFVGVRAQLNPTSSVYSGGSTIVTASLTTNSTTAYLLWNDIQGVSWMVGKMSQLEVVTPTKQWLPVSQAANGAPQGYFAWTSGVGMWIGLSVGSTYSVYGVTGITAAAPLTDNLALSLIAKVPLVRKTGMQWHMDPLAWVSLQQSRSSIKNQPALAANGSPAISGPPEMLVNCPIILTNSITDTEDNSH